MVVRDWQGRKNRLEYHEGGGVSQLHYGNGLVEHLEHSRTGRQEHAVVRDSSRRRNVSEQCYGYDLDGRLTSRSDVWGQAPGARDDRAFAYDPAGRLIREATPDGRSLAEYAYDAKGNLVEDRGRQVEVGPMDEPVRHDGKAIEYDGAGRMARLPGKAGELRCAGETTAPCAR